MKARLYETTGQRCLAEIEIHLPADLVVWPGADEPDRYFIFDRNLCVSYDDHAKSIAAYREAGIVATVGTHLGRLPA